MNKYQSVAKSFSCEPCPSGYFTSGLGKKSKDDCKGMNNIFLIKETFLSVLTVLTLSFK